MIVWIVVDVENFVFVGCLCFEVVEVRFYDLLWVCLVVWYGEGLGVFVVGDCVCCVVLCWGVVGGDGGLYLCY